MNGTRLTIHAHQANEQETIREIIVEGNKVLNADAIIKLSGHAVGDPPTPMVLTEMRDKLVQTGYFGMHHPDQPDAAVRIKAEELRNRKYKVKVTVTVDENDKITAITTTGTGPITPEQVKERLSPTSVFNPKVFARDAEAIIDLYNKDGYQIVFGKELGMDAKHPGLLVIPIFLTRVEKIVVLKDGVESPDPRLLRGVMTKAGGYLKRKTLYEVDRKLLVDSGLYDDVTITEKFVSANQVQIEIKLRTTKDNP
jgi:outer membrane protein assembly factor BamA